MKPFRQLLRQPVRAAAALILLTAAAASLCLGWGVLRSSQAAAERIDNSFVCLSQISPNHEIKLRNEIEPDETGALIVTNKWEVIAEKSLLPTPQESDILVSDFEAALEESPCLQGIYHHQYQGAYVQGLQSVTSVHTGSKYNSHNSTPYNRAVLTFVLTRVGEIDEKEFGALSVNLYGEVKDYLAIHPDFEPRSKIQLEITTGQYLAEKTRELINSLEVGKTYIVNMMAYNDLDLGTRTYILNQTSMGRRGYTAEDVNLDCLGNNINGQFGYFDPEIGSGITLAESALEDVDCCYSSFDMNVGGCVLSPVEGSVEDFLADPENADWAALLDTVKTQYSTVPVLGTDLLDSFYLFHEKTAYVAEGRGFDSADYADGNRVCLISQTLAQANGLHVGDKLNLDFFDNSFISQNPGQTTHGAEGYSAPYLYPNVEEFQESREYEIIGLYNNTKEWENLDYNILPSMVFVPNASLAGLVTVTDNDFLKSIVIRNGAEGDVEALFAEKGWPTDLLVYFDGGYSAIKEAMVGFMDSPRQLFMLAVAAFLVILTVYVALFVMKQRRNAGLMLSLGAGKGRAGWFVFSVSAIPAVISCILGAALGAVLLRGAVTRVLGDSVAYVKDYLDFSPNAVFVAAAVMAGVEIAVLGVVSIVLSHRKAASLMKK